MDLSAATQQEQPGIQVQTFGSEVATETAVPKQRLTRNFESKLKHYNQMNLKNDKILKVGQLSSY